MRAAADCACSRHPPVDNGDGKGTHVDNGNDKPRVINIATSANAQTNAQRQAKWRSANRDKHRERNRELMRQRRADGGRRDVHGRAHQGPRRPQPRPDNRRSRHLRQGKGYLPGNRTSATRLLRETPDAEDYGFILAQFKRRWPSMDADDMGYALGYALGRLSERDRVLESMPAVTEGKLARVTKTTAKKATTKRTKPPKGTAHTNGNGHHQDADPETLVTLSANDFEPGEPTGPGRPAKVPPPIRSHRRSHVQARCHRRRACQGLRGRDRHNLAMAIYA